MNVTNNIPIFSTPKSKLNFFEVKYNEDVQQILNVLAFFLIFPAISIIGNSVTFYIFIWLTYKVGGFWSYSGKGKKWLLFFLFSTLLSSVFAPFELMTRHTGFISIITILTQWVYWIFLAIFFIVSRNKIDYEQISKWIFYGTFCAIICFYFIPFRFEASIIEFDFKLSRNSFVFTLLCSIPVSFYYLRSRVNVSMLPLFFLFYFIVMLFTNGRSGGSIIIVEMILIASVIYPSFQKAARYLFVLFLLFFMFDQAKLFDPVKEAIANQVDPINPRFAAMLRGEEGDTDGDLTFDKSWLLRLLMIEKGYEIVENHPALGIGPNNFAFYDSELRSLDQYERLGSQDRDYFNSRSSHNSYVQIVSEFGIVGFIIFIPILFLPIIVFVRLFLTQRLEFRHLFLVGILGASMHFYAINTITGAIAWMFIGFAWFAIYDQRINPFKSV